MATVFVSSSGKYCAKWWIDGKQRSEMTSSRVFERALKEANRIEAIDRFKEDLPIFRMWARMNFSADFCHDNFTHRSHLRLPDFRLMLKQAGVEFVVASRQVDKIKETPRKAEKFEWKGAKRTILQIADLEGWKVSEPVIRRRIREALSECHE
jgi:hypothetical protein